MNRLSGKVAIVTGGANGIGAAIVGRFCEEGAQVVIADVDVANGQATAQRSGALFVPANVSDHAAIGRLVEETVTRFGRLTTLVSNAAIFHDSPVERTTRENWQRVLDANLTPTYSLAHFAAPHLRQQPGAAIVIIASAQGMRGFKNFAAYAASKGGQLSLMRALAAELAPQVRVNAISPGTIRSHPAALTLETERAAAAWHMLARIGECVEVANAAVFLASDEASFITGANLPVDGGLTAKGD